MKRTVYKNRLKPSKLFPSSSAGQQVRREPGQDNTTETKLVLETMQEQLVVYLIKRSS